MNQEEINRLKLLERRRNRRYPYETRIWLEESFGASLIKLNTLNLSATGLLFVSRSDYPVGKRMKILLELPYFLDLIEAETSVRHVTPMDDGSFSVGINLEEVKGITERGLKMFLKTLMDHESTGEDISSSVQDTIREEND